MKNFFLPSAPPSGAGRASVLPAARNYPRYGTKVLLGEARSHHSPMRARTVAAAEILVLGHNLGALEGLCREQRAAPPRRRRGLHHRKNPGACHAAERGAESTAAEGGVEGAGRSPGLVPPAAADRARGAACCAGVGHR